MTTLVCIPNTTALHLPKPTSAPLPLSSGDLNLTLIPANPPTHPSPSLTLTIGSSSFPLLPNSPVQKIKAKEEHASYVFAPVPADGGESIGQVKIVMKDSKTPGEWEATEALCHKFEESLKEHKCWNDTILFVDDEYEHPEGPEAQKGWGEVIAGSVIGAGAMLANRLNTYTDKHVQSTHPTHPAPPSKETISSAALANSRTAGIAEQAEASAQKFGEYIHEAGKKVGEALPDAIAKEAPQGGQSEEEKSEARKMAEGGWAQMTIAYKGLAEAATTVAGSLSTNAHKAVEHNFGKQADKVAQDIGQTGANVGSVAVAAHTVTSAIVQGGNVSTGLSEGTQRPATVPTEKPTEKL